MAAESQIDWFGLGNAGKRSQQSWTTRTVMLALEAPPPSSPLKTPRLTESRPFHPLLHGVSTKTGIPLKNFHLHQRLGVDKGMFNWDSLHLMSWAGFANIMVHYSAYLFPANKKSQNEQATALSTFYSSNRIKGFNPADKGKAGAEDGTWFTIKEFAGAQLGYDTRTCLIEA